MKYYKLLTKQGYPNDCFIINKIYPETFTKGNSRNDYSVKEMSKKYPSDWQEASTGDYFVQEGKMPEYFAIKRVADNPLWKKYIYWINNMYSYTITGEIDEYYGFDGRIFIDPKLKHFKNNPVELTLEQWDQIVNKNVMEEFKLPENWYINVTDDNVDMLNKWYKNEYITLTNEYLVGMSKWNNSDVKKGYNPKGITKGKNYDFGIKITTEQFIKYVLKEEVMNKEIIGWKLKDDCKQYEKAAEKIADFTNSGNIDGYFSSWMKNTPNGSFVNSLRKAGVLELWFEPVYKEEFKIGDWVTFYLEYNQRTYTDKIKEWTCHSYCILEGGLEPFKHLLRKATTEEIKAVQTLQFGGYDVTFEKVTSGIRITCNGETGTFSQLDKIYKFATEETRFKFGSANIKSIEYDDGTEWTDDSSDTPVSITIGCTTGTWKEFVTIYEKAKSML